MRKLLSKEVMMNRVQNFIRVRNEMKKDVDLLHVKLQIGNSKTGANCWTVSLLPVVDCRNCSECKWDCYDIKNVLWKKTVLRDRCRNYRFIEM